jgi:hypothetical protein
MKHRLSGFNECGKVKDAVERLSLGLRSGKNSLKSTPVRQLSLNEFHAGWEKIAPSVAEIVKNDGPVTLFCQ